MGEIRLRFRNASRAISYSIRSRSSALSSLLCSATATLYSSASFSSSSRLTEPVASKSPRVDSSRDLSVATRAAAASSSALLSQISLRRCTSRSSSFRSSSRIAAPACTGIPSLMKMVATVPTTVALRVTSRTGSVTPERVNGSLAQERTAPPVRKSGRQTRSPERRSPDGKPAGFPRLPEWRCERWVISNRPPSSIRSPGWPAGSLRRRRAGSGVSGTSPGSRHRPPWPC